MASETDQLLHDTLNRALRYLSRLDDTPVGPTVSADELRRRFSGAVPETGTDPGKVIEELVVRTEGGLMGNAGGRFYAWVIGGVVPASLAADWLTSTWDQNPALQAVSPAAAAVEEACGRWLKDLLGLPENAGFALVTGCQMAHVTALAAARNELLRREGWDVETKGLAGSPPIRLLCGAGRHPSVDRALRLLGLGTDCVVEVATDPAGSINEGALEKELAAGTGPTIVVLQAGEINTGAFDAFDRLVPLAHEQGAWVHVDGAFGLWAAVSERFRHHLAGVQHCDSWTANGHKWLNVPFDSGYAFVRDPDSLRRAMSYRGATYLSHAEDFREPMDWNPEWSRRARCFATWAAIRQLGRAGIAQIIDCTCAAAAELVERIGGLPGAEIVARPLINQGLVRFLDPDPGATEADHDEYTDRMIAALVRDGTAFFQGSHWSGKRCRRISVCSWRTDQNDIDRTVNAVRRCLAGRAVPARTR